jgi:hypothetical protein
MFFLIARTLKKKAATSALRPLRKPFAVFAVIFPLVLAVTLFSCAQVLVPNGGDKDTTPPKVAKYMPDSAAVNFRAKEINIAFNEYIQLKDVNNQLLISPLMDEMPEVKLVKNKIINISFKKPLKENTTYTLNFGNSIADYNEGNVLEGFRYIFSTGNFIDSLSVSGKVDYAFDHKTEKGVLVMLHEDQSDSAPYKLAPSYFTKTRADGSFTITNLKEGTYKIFALKDENKNYRYDAESEFIGFTDSLVEAGTKRQISLLLFKEVPKKLKLLNSKAVEYGHISLVFNKPAEDLKIKVLNVGKIPTKIVEFSRNKDTVDYWFEGITADSLKLQLSENDKSFDTVEVRLITKEQMERTSKGTKSQLSFVSNIVESQKFDLNQSVFFRFNHPIKGLKPFGYDSVYRSKKDTMEQEHHQIYLLDHDRSRTLNLSSRYFTYLLVKNLNTGNHDSIVIPRPYYWLENHTYSYTFLPGYFTDIFGNTNDTIKLIVKAQEEKYYGTLKLKLNVPPGNYILQLLDSKENVVKEDWITNTGMIDYSFLKPGAFKLKLIYDGVTNTKWSLGNRKWDPGNYLEKKQPEKVLYYDQPITIRSNWDLEIDWKIK